MNQTDHQIKPWKLVTGGMLALAAAIGIGRFVYTPILPMMVTELNLSAAQAGMIASSNFAGYLVGAMLAASSMIRGSARAWLLIGLITSAITTLAMAWTVNYIGFLVMRFIGGVVSAWVLVFATTLVIARLVEIGRSAFTWIFFGGVGVGIVLASVFSGLAVWLEIGWKGAWINNGLAAVAAVIFVCLLIPAEHKQTKKITSRPKHSGAPTGKILVAYGLFGFGYVITATFIVQLVRLASYSLGVEVIIWVLVGISAIPSVWIWNRYAAVVGNTAAFSVACVVLAIGVAATTLLPGILGLIVGAIFLGSTFMGITALGLVEARTRSSKDPQHILAMMTVSFGIGQIIGPAIGGYMSDVFGSFLLPSLLASIMLLIAAWLARQ